VLLGDDPDGGSLCDSDALAQSVVSLHLGGEEAGGVDDKGMVELVSLKELAGEVTEVFLGGDGLLGSADGPAELSGNCGRDLVLEVSGGDSGVAAPDMHSQREVVADDRDLIALSGSVDDGIGVRAGRALEVLKLEDSDLGPGGGLEHGGVFEG